jgi:hypothetical protein
MELFLSARPPAPLLARLILLVDLRKLSSARIPKAVELVRHGPMSIPHSFG